MHLGRHRRLHAGYIKAFINYSKTIEPDYFRDIQKEVVTDEVVCTTD